MKAFLLVAMLGVSFQLPIVSASAQTTTAVAQAPVETLNLYVGQAHVLNEGNIKRIAVGNGRVMQATALDDRQVIVIPENPGQSTLHLWERSGRQKNYVVNVVTADVARLQTEIQAMLGETGNIRSRVVGDKVVVEGTNLSEEQGNRLSEVSKRYPQIVNLVSKVGLERMIAMDVRMVEIKREAMHNIGIKWNGSAQGPTFGVIGGYYPLEAFTQGTGGAGAASTVGLATQPWVQGIRGSIGIASTISSMINLLVQSGDAVLLAEPRLSCRSGGTARFIAGGELPIPQAGGLGTVSVSYKEYGVKFEVSPVASETGVIAAKIATEISAINFEVSVNSVPGLSKRRAETDVNLRENETLVIAGLISDETSRTIDKVAGLGDLPILGALFRSRAFRDRNTDLVVFMTPRFVDPTPAQASPTNELSGNVTPAGSTAVVAQSPQLALTDSHNADLGDTDLGDNNTQPPTSLSRLHPDRAARRVRAFRGTLRVVE